MVIGVKNVTRLKFGFVFILKQGLDDTKNTQIMRLFALQISFAGFSSTVEIHQLD